MRSHRVKTQIGKRRQAAAALVAYLIVAGCRTRWESDAVEQERLDVAAWTLPPGGSVLSDSGLRRTAHEVASTWELSAPITWEQYVQWIEEGYRRSYRRIGIGDRSLSFSRLEKGDQFLVDIVAVVPRAPVRLRVTFTGRPE